MAIDGRTGAAGSRGPSGWRRLLAGVRAFEAAMDTSSDEIQDRRLLALEREVARLRGIVEAGRGGNRSDPNGDT